MTIQDRTRLTDLLIKFKNKSYNIYFKDINIYCTEVFYCSVQNYKKTQNSTIAYLFLENIWYNIYQF